MFIAIEGLDASGKQTQSNILAEHIDKMNWVRKISFPDYEHKSSTLAKMYLDGEIGDIDNVNAFAASSFYSLDRYISFKTLWEQDYKKGCIFVSDRYTTSNICHQMVKLPEHQWDEYISWLYNYEYELLQIPKPDLVIYLDMPPSVSKQLMELRYGKDESKKDIHEKNYDYLKKCRQASLFAAKKLGWDIVDCCDDRCLKPLSIDDISKKVKEIYNIKINSLK